jgi:cytochrome c oxidase assembly protein subunit 15
VAGVVGQIVLGKFTVLFELAPPFVMGHFLLSLVLVANAVALHHRAGEPDPPTTTVDLVEPSVRRLVYWLVPALAVAVVAGTVVTATGPHGGDEDAPRFGFEIETVTRWHSLAVLVFGGLLLAVLHRLSGPGGHPDVALRARQLLVVAVAQAVVGWTQYFTGVPALLVGVHIAGATLCWVALWRLVLSCRRQVALVGTVPRYEQVPA